MVCLQRLQEGIPVFKRQLFVSDTEKFIAEAFSGKIDKLEQICAQLGGEKGYDGFAYDLVVSFAALPRISLLLLFNEGDDEFPAHSTVLFQKQAEHYLDPESLAMTSAYLARQLKTFGNNQMMPPMQEAD